MEDVGFRGFFFQAEDGIRDGRVTGFQTCALPICGCDRFKRFRNDEFTALAVQLCPAAQMPKALEAIATTQSIGVPLISFSDSLGSAGATSSLDRKSVV